MFTWSELLLPTHALCINTTNSLTTRTIYLLWGVCTLPSTKRPFCNSTISLLQRVSVRTLYYF